MIIIINSGQTWKDTQIRSLSRALCCRGPERRWSWCWGCRWLSCPADRHESAAATPCAQPAGWTSTCRPAPPPDSGGSDAAGPCRKGNTRRVCQVQQKSTTSQEEQCCSIDSHSKQGRKKRKTISTTDINASRTTLFSWLSFKTGKYNSLFFSSFSLSVTLKYVNVTKISTNMYSLTDDQMVLMHSVNMYSLTDDQMILTHRLDMWIKTNQ